MSHSHHTDNAGDDSLIILDEPIILKDGREFSELQLREPNVFHTRSAAQVIGKRASTESVYDSQIKLVSLVGGWPVQAVQELPASILDRAVAYVMHFQDDARRPEGQEPDMSPSMLLVLDDPIEAVNGMYSEMALREPKVKEQRRAIALGAGGSAADSINAEAGLVELVSGWPTAAVNQMPISKFAQAADYLTGFFMHGPATATT